MIKHIISSSQFNLKCLEDIFLLTDRIREISKCKKGVLFFQNLLRHKRAILYFNQPSTRTFISFQSACYILGINVSEIRDLSTSSEHKGESVEDSLRTLSSYVDLIIMRSKIPKLCEKIANMIDQTSRPVPIINAGSGPDEHPTQAILDIYTLKKSFENLGGLSNKTICMVGDLKRGRTIRSLIKLIVHYDIKKIILVSPKCFEIKDDIRNFLKKRNIDFIETRNLYKNLKIIDAIYMTRVQYEYNNLNTTNIDYDKNNYALKYEHLGILKKNCAIMHPLPRLDELDPKIDSDPRAKYWCQERNGMWIRTALISKIFNLDKTILDFEIK